MVHPIKLYPEDLKFLISVCSPVVFPDSSLQQLAQDLIDTAAAQKYPLAAGLAAPQIGVLKRVIVISRNGEWITMVNPIFDKADFAPYLRADEGCLSLPKLTVGVARYELGIVRFQDIDGKPEEILLDAFAARCVQHEIDHLDGILLIHPERAGRVRRILALEKYAKLRGLKLK